jgi:hypothetical protein
MKTNHTTIQRLTLAVLLICSLPPASAFAQGTAFTYQGRLNDSGNPANGTYDLRFTVWDAPTNGTPVAGPLTNAAMGITNGFFTVTLDFGGGVFTGPDRWLQLDARTNGTDTFTTLYPFQQLLPMPYAIMANSASNLLGTLPASQLNGTIPLTQLPGAVLTNNGDGVVLSGIFSGDGSGLTNLLAGNLSGIFTGNVIGSASTATNFSGPLAGDVTGTQGATVVASVGGQSAANVASGVSAANAATSAATPNAIVSRDPAGSFAGTSLTLNGNLSLPATTNNGGVIYLDGAPFIHGYGGQNFFAGTGAGNFTMSGNGGNTAVGFNAMQANTTGSGNTVVGTSALGRNTTGSGNVGFGGSAIGNNTTGSFNTAIGPGALFNNTTGSGNAAVGPFALQYNTTGGANTAIGDDALAFNTGGFDNTAIGSGALEDATGSYNVALGVYAGESLGAGNSNIDIGNVGYPTDTNIIRIGQGQTQTYIAGVIHGDGSGLMNVNVSTNFNNIYLPAATSDSGVIYSGSNAVLNLIGYENLFVGAGAGNFSFQAWPWPGDDTALGYQALHNASNGWYNTAVGALALYNNLDGSWNLANGYQSLYSNLTGSGNIAIGVGTLFSMTNGSANTAIGNQALYSAIFGTNNTAVGTGALSSIINGTNNIALGYLAGANVQYGNNIEIGNQGNAYDEGVIRIGDGQWATYIAGVIYGNGSGLSNLDLGEAYGLNISLPSTGTMGTSLVGIIYAGDQTLIHDFGTNSFFAGSGAGNLTMSGGFNTGIGALALGANTSGAANTALGQGALGSNTSGGWNIALGSGAGASITSGSSNIDIGNPGQSQDTNIIRIGDQQTQTFIAGVITGDGSGLTNLNVSNLAGTFTGNVTGSASSATNFSGLLTGDVTGPQGATVVASVGGQSAANVAAGVSAANAATEANTPDTIVFRDSSGNFNGGTLTLDGSLWLPATTTSAGIIYSGGIPFVYAYGTMNFFAGTSAGNLTMVGSPPWYGYNTGLGAQAMQNNDSGICNTASGALALQNNASGAGNTASGAWSLQANTAGSGNTAYGYSALQNSADGDGNIAVGRLALANTVHAAMNIALGDYAGYSILAGGSNIDIGNTGQSQDTNIIRIGDQQTQTFIAGVITGDGSGLTNLSAGSLSGSLSNINNLNVSGGLTVGASALINGGLSVNNGAVGIGVSAPSYTLQVNGSVAGVGAYNSLSDARYKTNITTLTHALDKIMALRGVQFDWRTNEYPEWHFEQGTQLGLIAQEVGQVLPEAVSQDAQGCYSLAYSKLIPVLVEAVKDQQKQTEKKDAELQIQSLEIRDLKQSVAELKTMVEELSAK